MTDRAAPAVLVVEHERTADAAFLGDRLAAAGITVHTVGPDRATPVPGDLVGYDGLIVLGGAMDPDDDDGAPWLPAVRALLAQAIRLQRPTLAVCLGSQLLGMVAGGQVRLIPAGPEVGLELVRPTAAARDDPVLRSLGERAHRVLQWHWWEVTALPAECAGYPVTVLADSAQCPVQAFVVGSAVWGMQFHLEALPRTVAAWAAAEREELQTLGVDPDGLFAEVVAAEVELNASWAPVVDAWAALVCGTR